MKIIRQIYRKFDEKRLMRCADVFLRERAIMIEKSELDIQSIFQDSFGKRRLIILSSRLDLQGRAFFIESLKCTVLRSLPKDLSEDDIICFLGYSDFLDHIRKIRKLGHANIIFLEAGFLRGVLMDGSNSIYDRAYCFFVDDLGFHYDPTHPSRLQAILNDPNYLISADQINKSITLSNFMISNKLTKYNDQDLSKKPERANNRTQVLVVEQARNDWAVIKSGGGSHSFNKMLGIAISQNPDADILVKVHPDTINGKRGGLRKSYFGRVHDAERVSVVREKVNPISLLQSIDKVYVFSSMLGFEAAMMGKEVHVFGKPCYAGWGATIDYADFPDRKVKRTLHEIFYVIYFVYQKYKDDLGNWTSAEMATQRILELRDQYFEEISK